MSRQENIRRSLEIANSAIHQGTVLARQVAGKVSAEASRQAEIARPIVQAASRKAWAEVQRQTAVAKPIVHEATRRAAAVSVRGLRQAVPFMQQARQKYPWLGKTSLGFAAALMGMIVLANSGSDRQSRPSDSTVSAEIPVTQEIPENSPAVDLEPQWAESPVEEPAPIESDDVAQTEFGGFSDVFEQWRHQPPSTTGEYEPSMSQWNASTAPRRSGYSPEQMGRFAAAGYRPHLQPQPYGR
jgi:hypothetical protein